MTTADLISYYAGLLIMQYFSKPNAIAMVKAQVTPIIMDQLPVAVQDAFNIDTAVGVQLDVLGKYAGVIRSGGGITLSDADFRKLIKLAIVTNSSGSDLATIQRLLNMFFENEIFVFDHLNMRMSYYLNTSVGSQDLANLFISEGLLPRPMGVQMAVAYAPATDTFFGFRTYTTPAIRSSPFNTYTSYSMSSPWLSYADALT